MDYSIAEYREAMDYSLKDLRTLDALLRHQHVSQAADRTGMSQPAMSMMLKRMRETFGDRLLVRRGNRLVLTEAAIRLHPRIQVLIREMEELATDTGGFNPARTRRTFTMILTDYIDAILVPALHGRLAEIAPYIELRVIGPDPFRIANVFGEGRVDLTVSYFPGAPGDLMSRRMFSDRMVCLVRDDHPALGEPLTLEAFCSLDHAAIEPAEATMYRAVLDNALLDLGLTRRVAVSKPDFMGIPFLLEQSNLIATMPSRLARMFANRFALTTFAPPLDLPLLDVQMMWHKSTQHSEGHIWLRNLVSDILSELPKDEDQVLGKAPDAGRGDDAARPGKA